MTAIDLHLKEILIIKGSISSKPLNIIYAGTGWHNGETFEVKNDSEELIEIGIDLLEDAIPLTGLWKKRYQDYDFYISIK